ncbi:immunoglobulin-like domain-containing protein [Alkalicoccus chagannorensis]|uniref:immunoglobulin-like domain-containing protein n=1 Tax=Alkalicoccus chagannorensis TaxID=427072 RepID=UPI000428FE8A|nr:immunoglobulin-like domain-containing protein [Alkalicoccus chagannorensis]
MYRLSGAAVLLLAGCGTEMEVTTESEPEQAPQEHDSVYGSMDGETETWVWPEAGSLDPIRNTEYEEGMGDAFQDGFMGAHGITHPDEEVEISGVTVPWEGSVRYRLTERTEELELVEVIEETTTTDDSFAASLPEKDTMYIISAETLDDEGNVTDTFAGSAAVPPQEANAELSVEENAGGYVLQLENRGPTELFFGLQYHVEEAENGDWERTLDHAFEDIGLTLPPGDTYEQELDLDGVGSGEFRITKDFSVNGTDIEERLGVYGTRD